MEKILLFFAMAAPVTWLSFLLAPAAWANRRARDLGAWMEFVMACSGLPVAIVLVLVLMGGAPLAAPIGGVDMVYIDVFSAGMALLIAFIGWVIIRYSLTYLAGDPRQGEFLQWLGAALGSVFLLVVAGNLFLMLGAWIATSLSLHYLLAFYAERPAAVVSARKKFIFSRAADLFLIGASILLFQTFGTVEISRILEQARNMAGTSPSPELGLAILCLAGGAILKSAQFPFHTWLPDTLETPTPVSALMHAGIISAGGFLLIRLSPVVVLAPQVLCLLMIVGAVTAIFGSVVMLTQTSIKKALAFSTVAQMGYMILQCGLGLFALAALHLFAHSLYKAHAFLSSGSTISQVPSLSLSEKSGKPRISGVIWMVFGLGFCAVLAWLCGVSLTREPGWIVMGFVLALAMATFLAKWRLSRGSSWNGLAMAGFGGLYFALHHWSTRLLAGTVPTAPVEVGFAQYMTMLMVIAGFGAVFFLQANVAGLNARGWGARLYVLVFNRFYINALVNRLMLKVWPPTRDNSSQA